MKLTIEHTTQYEYDHAVRQSIQYLRLTPHDTNRQKIISWSLNIPGIINQTVDAYGNILHVITLDEPHESISIKVKGEVEIIQDTLEDNDHHLSRYAYLRNTALTQADTAIKMYSQNFFAKKSTSQALNAMMHDLLIKMPYRPGHTQVYESAADVFEKGCGVCQDHSHVFIAACRFQGIPARYISGYIYSADSSHVASHAWVEAWFDDQWHTFDITNGLTSPSFHLKLAVGLDYLDACPIRGVRIGGGDETMMAVAKVNDISVSLESQQ